MIRRNSRRGFTLIELLLVLVILAVLAAVVVPRLAGRAEDAKRKATIADISNLKSVLNTFEIDNGRFPRTEEGLQALVAAPTELQNTWKGPYVDKIPLDKWDHEYQYKSDDAASFNLFSVGPDGQEGTADDITMDTLR